MDGFADWINGFIKTNFKRKFLLLIAVPFLLSSLFIIDFLLLPEHHQTESLRNSEWIFLPNHSIASKERSKHMGYNYTTENDYKFSTLRTKIESSYIEITSSPIFKTVKTVTVEGKEIAIQSGLNGVLGVLMISGNLILLISGSYVLLKQDISQNARLNLSFLSLFLFAIWGYALIEYG
ncbi:hypothetical protein [Cellulophaga baltica]|uniref:hypothetical protein n=1 Tax=Cellulophaga baltica TaxID=76594 RepID=UPI000408BBA4|nr:hypothetical protein [Cellulophaga baltica]